MNRKTQLLIVGAATEETRTLEAYLRAQPWFKVEAMYCQPSEAPRWPAPEVERNADVVILSLSSEGTGLLDLVPRQRGRWEMIVVGPANDLRVVRNAMQRGARDYLPHPVAAEELSTTLRQLSREKSMLGDGHEGRRITSIINTKGGSGGSFVAANLAHVLATDRQLHTALLDCDLQFGVQSLSFDVEVNPGIRHLLGQIFQLDAVALQGYMARHKSGVHLLAEKLAGDVVLPGELDLDAVERLLELLNQGFDHVVVDLPRQLDALFSTVVGRSHHVVLVMQQSVAHVRDAKRLLDILRVEFDLPPERITVLVNRFNDKNSIALGDIERTIDYAPLRTLGNDFKRAVTAIDTATPLNESAPTAPVTREFKKLALHLRGEADPSPSFFRRALGGILG